jgi:hypothetical protein
MEHCLLFIFGESVSGINIKQKPRSNPRWAATTRKNKIIVYTDCSGFFNDTFVVLEEYYHVLRQWNRGRMTRISYLLESARNGYRGNKFENEAWEFVEWNKSDFDDCLKCPTLAPMGIGPGGVAFSGFPR